MKVYIEINNLQLELIRDRKHVFCEATDSMQYRPQKNATHIRKFRTQNIWAPFLTV